MTDERFELSSGTKKKIFIAIGAGLILFIIGMILMKTGVGMGHHGEHEAAGATHEAAEAHHGPTWMSRVWANLWLNNVYFVGIALIGVFWVAVQYVAEAGWSTLLKRIPESFGMYLPIGGVLMVIIFFLGGHDIFHWTHEGIMDPTSENYDAIIAGKQGYLNTGFFVGRMIAYIALWSGFWYLLRKQSLLEDEVGGLDSHKKSFRFSAIFLVIFAVSSSTSAWDWVLSIDTHWFSTMFGWYVFASWFISGISAVLLITVLLKEAGYLKQVTREHLHDLGKFQFGFSIFWCYIWFSQFMLIWYANVPEESVYFVFRFENYKALLFINLIVNFFFPFLVLMTHQSKREFMILKVVSVALLIGHWLDFYLMIMPGTMKGTSGGFGGLVLEIGGALFFFGVFAFLLTRTLSKAGLIAKNHPFLEESVHHHV